MTSAIFRSTFSPSPIALLISLAWGAAAMAQTPPPAQEAPPMLREVLVSAARSERFDDALPLSFQLISADAMEQGQMSDIHDVAKSIPNVSVKHAPARFSVTGVGNAVGADGNAGFSIRGQGGNRVVMLVDGVRLPRSYLNGSTAFGRDTVSVGLLKRIEILYGPASALYGSDGLAGLVNFITLEPSDFLLTDDGKARTLGGRAWAAYSGDDQGATLGATLAARTNEQAQWSLTATQTHASAVSTMGSNDTATAARTSANPQSTGADSLLGKLVLTPSEVQKHVLTLEHVHKNSDVDLLSRRGVASTTALITAELASSAMERNRFGWDAHYQTHSDWADSVQTVLSWQDATAQENGQTLRSNRTTRVRKTAYNERSLQANVHLEKNSALSAAWSQTLSYGLDLAQTDVSSVVDGSDPAGFAAFGLRKYFPDTRDASQALYLQDEFLSERWSITPGLRLDQFSLSVLSQDGYYPGLATAPGKSLSGAAASPKLGVLFHATPQWAVFANYAGGFRAPEGQQVNSVYEAPAGTFAKLLPNPDLKPEESRNTELGLRFNSPAFKLGIAVFNNQYSNLIVDKLNLGPAVGTALNPTLFQTVNIDKASINGYEIKGQAEWGQWLGGQWSTPFSYGQTRGSNDTTGLPLNSIDPAKLTTGIHYDSGAWNLRLDAVFLAEKKLEELDSAFVPKSTTQRQFLTPATSVLSLSGQWRLRKNTRLNFAIENLTDQKYWNWSDVPALASNVSPVVVDAYTQPGRHLNLSLVADF